MDEQFIADIIFALLLNCQIQNGRQNDCHFMFYHNLRISAADLSDIFGRIVHIVLKAQNSVHSCTRVY